MLTLRICLLIWSTGISGGTKIEFELAKLFASSHEVVLCCLGSKKHEWFNFGDLKNRIEFLYIEPEIYLPFIRRVSIYGIIDNVRKLLKIPYEPNRIRYLAERIPPDCDVYVATYFPSAIALLLSMTKGKRVYFVQDIPELAIENEGFYGIRLFEQSLQCPFDAFICNSNYTKEVVTKLNGKARVFVGGIGIDTKTFSSLNDSGIRRSRDRFVVMTIIRKQKIKGAEMAVEALNILAKKVPIHVLFVVEDLRVIRKLNPAFVFTAYKNVPAHSMAKLYRNSDIFLFTSYAESFGLPPLEAMACGTPVVMTDAKGTRDYAVNNYNAIVIKPGDSRAVAEATHQVLVDEALRRRLVEGGLETSKKWSWDTKFPLVEGLFYKLLNSA